MASTRQAALIATTHLSLLSGAGGRRVGCCFVFFGEEALFFLGLCFFGEEGLVSFCFFFFFVLPPGEEGLL